MIILLALCTLVCRGHAQSVKVIDHRTEAPIPFVTIQLVNTNKGTVTNNDGEASLSNFPFAEALRFSHPSYKNIIYTMEQLRQMNFLVRMEERIVKMDEVVISANKWEQNKSEIPQQIAEITPATIAFNNPRTAAEALESSGQVFVQKSQLGGGSPIIRGFAANSVLIVIDGVRMNNAIYRSGNLQNVITLDANNLKGAEVVFGPGSVMYGSDALGGVMDFHTKDPEFSNDNKTRINGLGFLRYGSAAKEKTGHFQWNIGKRRFSSFTSVTFSDFDDLRTGSKRTDKFPDFGKRLSYVSRIGNRDTIITNPDVNKQAPSSYHQWNMLQKFRWRVGKFSELMYSGHYSTSSNIPRYDRLIEMREDGILKNAEWYYGPQQWQMHALQWSLFSPNRFFDQGKVIVSYQRVKESRHDRRFQNDVRRSRHEKVNLWALNADFEKEISEKQQLFYGVMLTSDDVASTAFAKNIVTGETSAASTRYPDGGSQMTTLAAYGSYQWKIRPHLIFSAGLRYTYNHLKSKFNDTTFFDFPFNQIQLSNGAVNGSMGLVFLPNQSWKVSMMVSSGFRTPNVDDVGKVFDSEPGNVIVPNPGLKPEYAYNGELGLSKKSGEKFKVEGVVYYSILRDALVRRDFTFNDQSQILYDGVLSQVQAEVNAGKAYIWGIHANFTAKIHDYWALKGAVTYTEGRDTTNDLPLRHVAPTFGQLSLLFKKNKLHAEWYSRFSGSMSDDDLAPSEQNKPHLYTSDGALSWATLNLRSSYQVNAQLSFNLSLENILDTHYRPYSSGISAAGFNAVASARITF